MKKVILILSTLVLTLSVLAQVQPISLFTVNAPEGAG
jgi:hypothetical protein